MYVCMYAYMYVRMYACIFMCGVHVHDTHTDTDGVYTPVSLRNACSSTK